jgi:membrane-associated phospholipid phosphatase
MTDLPAVRPAVRTPPVLTRGGLWLAFQRVIAVVLVALALAGLLVQNHSRLPRFVYPVLFALPLCLAMFRREAQALRLWGAYVVSFVAFSMLRIGADDFGFPAHAAYVATMDRWLGLGTIPTHLLQSILPLSGPVVWAAVLVHLTYYAMPPLAGLVCWLRDARRFPRYTYSLVAIYVVSILAHIVLPTVPPWLAGITGTIEPVRRLVAEALNGWNPAFYSYGLYVAAGNDVAAMPSVHMAAVTVIACATWRTRWRWIGLSYPLAMGLSLVYLGEHYLTDIVAGAALAVVVWRVTERWEIS